MLNHLQKKIVSSRLGKASAFLLSLTLFFSANISLKAGELTITGGLWSGNTTSELEERFRKDDIIDFTSLARYDLPWNSQSTTILYPLSLSYKTKLWKGDLVGTVSYMQLNPSYQFNAISLAPMIAMVSLKDYREQNLDGDLGYTLELAGRFYITPLLGYRHHQKDFTYDELSFGSGIGISIKGPFKAESRSLYLGVGGRFMITQNISVFADLRRTSPLMGTLDGSMEFELWRFYTGGYGGVAGNVLVIDQANSNYQIDFDRKTIGGQFDLTKDLHFFGGLMIETVTTKYPGYTNIPWIISSNNPNPLGVVVMEMLTDQLLIYNENTVSEKGLIFLGASYDFDI